jgi:DNA-binding transcriptional MerR regulator
MFKIGEFARLSQVSVKTLHHYDDIGLFKPTWTDPDTGYRYYSMDQLSQLKHILTLKDMGLTLDQIAHVVRARPSPAELHALLREKQAELLQRIREDQARLARIDQHLGGGRGEHEPAAYAVSVGGAPELLIASIRTRIPHGALHDLHCELRAYLDRRRAVATRPGFTLFYPDDSGEGWLDVEAAIPLERPLPTTGRVGVRTLPAAERMACARHRGGYQTMYRAYEALGHWVEANGYRSLSPWRELYLRDGRTAVSPDAYVTEISIPIQPWKE